MPASSRGGCVPEGTLGLWLALRAGRVLAKPCVCVCPCVTLGSEVPGRLVWLVEWSMGAPVHSFTCGNAFIINCSVPGSWGTG